MAIGSSDAALASPSVVGSSSSTPTPTVLQPLGPKSTGVPGPGEFAGGDVDYSKTGVEIETFDSFGCKVPEVNPNTNDWEIANVYFERKVFMGALLSMPDGASVEHWGFEDRLKAKDKLLFPSPMIRVQENDLVHVKLETRGGPHTIHHHGIEPTTMNDGVGHVSFEVDGSNIYQWKPRQAGMWFYHCHRNTVLHFEMGLFGLLIVDPLPVVDTASGKMRIPAYRNGPFYEVEQFWVLDDIDPRWHTLDKSAGVCGDDAGLNKFEPKYFLINGVPTQWKNTSGQPAFAENARIVAKKGDKVLIRVLNASYSVVKITLPCQCSVISVDGHSLGDPERPWSSHTPYDRGHPIYLTTAGRHELLIDTSTFGTPLFPGSLDVPKTIEFEFQDWNRRKPQNYNQAGANDTYLGKARTTITVTKNPSVQRYPYDPKNIDAYA